MRQDFFIDFLVEWIRFTSRYIPTHGPEWLGIPGYISFIKAFMSIYHPPGGAPTLPPEALSVAETHVITTSEPAAFNCLMKQRFGSTSIKAVQQLNNCIAVLDVWLSALSDLKIAMKGDENDHFDVSFFCKGIDLLISSDHHFIVARTLVILYNHRHVFQGKAFEKIYEKTILEKHFYHLFLNWDDNVRCLFYQLILFKYLSCKKKDVLAFESYLSALKAAEGNYKLTGVRPFVQKPRFPKDINPTEYDIQLMRKIDSLVNSVITWKKMHPKDKPVQTSSGLVRQTAKKKFITEEPSAPTGFIANAVVGLQKDIEEEVCESPRVVIESVVAAITGDMTNGANGKSVDDGNNNNNNDGDDNNDGDNLICDIPQSRSVYISRALKEYKRHIIRYEEWEARGVTETPKLAIISYKN